MDKYDKLEKIKKLLDEGVLSEEEYEQERTKILGQSDEGGPTPKTTSGKPWDMAENTYLCVLHLSQLLWVAGGAGWILTLVMWLVNKDEFPEVDRHGKEAVNWLISALIYSIVCFILTFVVIGIFGFLALAAMSVIFPIIAAVKANQGEYWEYPLTIRLIK